MSCRRIIHGEIVVSLNSLSRRPATLNVTSVLGDGDGSTELELILEGGMANSLLKSCYAWLGAHHHHQNSVGSSSHFYNKWGSGVV